MNNHVSYEKETENVVTRIRHTVRIRLNSRAIDVKEILRNVPNDAIVSLVVGDDENDDHGEIIFDEEEHS